MSRLRERQRDKLAARRAARRRLREADQATDSDALVAEWNGDYALLAFLFAMPDELTMTMLDHRKRYFDVRTGEHWDLFFPGYFSSDTPELEDAVGSVQVQGYPVGSRNTSNWYFNESDFNGLRAHVEEASKFRWQYSGGADLVIAEMFIPASGGPTVDWVSTRGGTIEPPSTLAGVIESVTRDLERGLEDPDHGVGELVNPASEKAGESRVEKVLLSAVGNVVATAVKAGIHLQG